MATEPHVIPRRFPLLWQHKEVFKGSQNVFDRAFLGLPQGISFLSFLSLPSLFFPGFSKQTHILKQALDG